MKFAVVTFPYSMDTDAGTAEGPKALLQAGLADWLRALAGLLASLAGGLERRPLRVERLPVRAHPRSAENRHPGGEQCEGDASLDTAFATPSLIR